MDGDRGWIIDGSNDIWVSSVKNGIEQENCMQGKRARLDAKKIGLCWAAKLLLLYANQ